MLDNCITTVKRFALIKSAMEASYNANVLHSSTINSSINDILHIIEYIDLPANQMSKLTKKLKVMYKFRREIKESSIILQNILKNGKEPSEEIASSYARITRYEAEAIASFKKLSN